MKDAIQENSITEMNLCTSQIEGNKQQVKRRLSAVDTCNMAMTSVEVADVLQLMMLKGKTAKMKHSKNEELCMLS